MSSLDFLPSPSEELANGQAEKMETSVITCGGSSFCHFVIDNCN